MKQLLAILLALLMTFSLAACDLGNIGNNDNDDPGVSQTDNKGGEENPVIDVEDIDFGALMSGEGGTDVVWGKQDEATKQAIIAEGKKDGVDISFGSDGSMTVVDEDGTTMVQKPDGTWVIKDEEGNEGQVGGEWPDNEFTKLVPKPDFELYAASGDEHMFTVAFSNATIEGIRDYAEKLKAAGFTVDAETTDSEAMGMTIYTYIASNGKGVTAELAFGLGASSLALKKE